MKIPKSITVNTGEQQEIYENIEKFFLEVKSKIEKKVKIEKVPSKFKLDIVNLCGLRPGNPLESDEFAHRLFYKERIVAVVLETRTDSNYIHFDYFLNLSKPL